MIGLVLLSQGILAKGFYDLLKHLPDIARRVEYICLENEYDLETVRQSLMLSIDKVNQGKGVLIATELFCGNSTNLALSILDLKPIEVIAGTNLPLLLHLLQLPADTLLSEAATIAKETGRKHITIASNYLNTDFYDNEIASKPVA